MKRSDHPRGDVLQAYVDRELPDVEVEAVRDHCQTCAECRQTIAEIQTVQDVLAVDRQDDAAQPVWPQVAAELERERRLGRQGRIGPAFALGTATAFAAGIVVGLLVGAPDGDGRAAVGQVTWTSAEDLWTGGGGASLLDVFSSVPAQERAEGS